MSESEIRICKEACFNHIHFGCEVQAWLFHLDRLCFICLVSTVYFMSTVEFYQWKSELCGICCRVAFCVKVKPRMCLLVEPSVLLDQLHTGQ